MSLIEKIAVDMRRSGFPLEIEVGSQLSNRSWTTRHQAIFRDEDENKPRHIDIVAHKVIDGTFYQFNRLNYTIVCECKKSEKPWVFYAPPSDILCEKDLATLFYLKHVSWPSLSPRELVGITPLLQNHYVSKEPIERLAQAHYVAFSKDGEGSKDLIKSSWQRIKSSRLPTST